MRIMRRNSKKSRGFGLLEVVISIAILSIVSIAVYDGFMIMVKQTKAGQVKQTAAIEGKKIIEQMKGTSFAVPQSTDTVLKIGDITLQKEASSSYKRYLDEKYNELKDSASENSRRYVEKVTLSPTKLEGSSENVELNTSAQDSAGKKIYISRIDGKDYIRYWDKDEKYIPSESDTSIKMIQGDSQVKQMSVYFTLDSGGNQKIEIKDYKGNLLCGITKSSLDDKNLKMNFSNYIEADGSLPINADIEINVYNTTTDTPNIYIEKQKDLKVNVNPCKGNINIYDNRSEDVTNDNSGTLYDIKVEISDYLKYKNGEIKSDNDNLFTGAYKKNIH